MSHRSFNELKFKPPPKGIKGLLQQRGFAGATPWYYITKPHKIPKIFTHTKRAIRSFVERGRRGYAVQDTWSIHSYLLSWLPDAVAEMRKNVHSYPMDITYEEWLVILIDIESGLRAGLALDELDYDWKLDGETEKLEKQFKEAWDLMGKWFFNLWT